jgi:putative ABC transport system substrate-binding protein
VALNLKNAAPLQSNRKNRRGFKRLGILYDPKNNQQWYAEASALAVTVEMELVPLLVSRPSTQLEIVGDLTLPDAMLFIPDKTIISRSVIQHVIKEAYQRKVPVIGYNRFFYESGAALSFVIDYNKLGRQVGDQVNGLLSGEICQGTISPNFKVLVNDDAWRVLDLPRVTNKAVEGLGD